MPATAAQNTYPYNLQPQRISNVHIFTLVTTCLRAK